MKRITLLLIISLITLSLFGQIIDSTIADTTIIDSTSTLIKNPTTVNYISVALSALMFLLALVFGAKYYKKKLTLTQLIQAILDTIKDNKVTKLELERIILIFKSL